jgi:predicted flavoprotein YhiN
VTWIQSLGFDSFVGSSGRVFPTDMKAAPLLRAWLHRLREVALKFVCVIEWLGWNDTGAINV